jgi:hypothetical protein
MIWAALPLSSIPHANACSRRARVSTNSKARLAGGNERAPPKRGKDLERNQDEDGHQSQGNRGSFEAIGHYRFHAPGLRTSPAQNRCWKGTVELSRGGHGNGAPCCAICGHAERRGPRSSSLPQSTWPRPSDRRGPFFCAAQVSGVVSTKSPFL